MLSKNNKNSDSVKPSGLDSGRLMQIDDVVDRALVWMSDCGGLQEMKVSL